MGVVHYEESIKECLFVILEVQVEVLVPMTRCYEVLYRGAVFRQCDDLYGGAAGSVG